jgi:hypothetical protein
MRESRQAFQALVKHRVGCARCGRLVQARNVGEGKRVENEQGKKVDAVAPPVKKSGDNFITSNRVENETPGNRGLLPGRGL